MNWAEIIREVGIAAMSLQTDRFYALYVLLFITAILYLARRH